MSVKATVVSSEAASLGFQGCGVRVDTLLLFGGDSSKDLGLALLITRVCLAGNPQRPEVRPSCQDQLAFARSSVST